MNCATVSVELAVFYKRGEFLWIGADESEKIGSKKWFGDHPRAFNEYVFFKIFFIFIK